MPITLDGTNGITTPMYSGAISANAVTPSVNMKSRIINGAMVLDQRNAGASVTQSSSADVFPVDRFKINGNQNAKFTAQQNAGSVTPPTGFTNYLGITSSAATAVGASDYFLLTHNVEGFNVADLGWGSAGASTVTMSFWVRSSLTGTFGGAIANSAFNRSYPFTYTISAANTWEQKSITIAGDTSGTWLKTNGTGLNIQFGLGVGSTYSGTAGAWAGAGYISATGATSVVGTNGATFYITGVQLEVGSTATSFDYRPYGTELALCQRYYEKSFNIGTAPANGIESPDRRQMVAYATTEIGYQSMFQVSKRASPTMTLFIDLNAGTNGQWSYYNGSAWTTMTTSGFRNTTQEFRIDFSVTGRTFGQALIGAGNWTASAEL